MANNANGEDPKKCELCQRQGLPIYLTRVSVYDQLQDSKGPQQVPAELAPDVAKYKFQGARPSLRAVRTGFVYVFVEKYKDNPDKRWQVFRVHANGLIQRIPLNERLKSIAVCSRAADNMNPRFLVLDDAPHLGKVQLAFSEHAWTQKTMDAYAKDGGLRGKRMQEIDVTGWVKSQKAPKGGQAFDANFLVSHVGFWGAPKAEQPVSNNQPEYADKTKPIDMSAALAGTLYNSTEVSQPKVKDLDEAQKAIQSKAGLQGKALLFVIDDPLGLAADLNSLRTNKAVQKFTWMGGGQGLTQPKDADRPHKKQSAELIDQVMKAKYLQTEEEGEKEERAASGSTIYNSSSFGIPIATELPVSSDADIKRAGKDKADEKQKRMQKRYSSGAMGTFVSAYDKEFKAWDTYIAKFDHDWAGWVSTDQPHIDIVLTNDCDLKNARDLVALRNYTSEIYAGAVLSEASVTLYAKAYAAKQIADNNWIMRSLGLADTNLLGELVKEMGSPETQVDLGARLYDILKRTIENVQEGPAAWKEYHEALAEQSKHAGGHGSSSHGSSSQAHGSGHAAEAAESVAGGVAKAVIASDPLASKLVLFDQNTELLLYTGNEMMSRMAAAARAGKPIGGVNLTLIEVDHLQQRIFRFGAVNYALTKGEFLYTASVQIEVPRWLNAANEASPIVQADMATMRALDRIAKSSKTGAEAIKHAQGYVHLKVEPGAPKINTTVLIKSPLIGSKGGDIQVSAGGPMGVKSQAKILVNDETIVAQMAAPQAPKSAHVAPEAIKAPGAFKYGLSGVLFAFQAWLFFRAVNDAFQKEGSEQTQAVLSATSAAFGMASAGAEVVGLLRTRAQVSAAKLGEEGEVVASAMKASAAKYVFAAGVLAAASSFIDAIAMGLKAASKWKANQTAAEGYLASGGSFFLSSFATGGGAYLSYVAKGGQLIGSRTVVNLAVQRAGAAVATEAAEGALAATAAEEVAMASVGLVASWFTGVGLVLTIVGVAWALWAAMMDDDEAEALIRQTWWGIKDDKPKFDSLDKEMQAYYQYQFAVKAELNTERHWYTGGTIYGVEVSIGAGYFAPDVSICDYKVTLDGKVLSQGRYTGGKPSAPFTGGAKPVPDLSDVYFLDLRGDISFDSTNAQNVQVVYTIYPQGLNGPNISDTLSKTIDNPTFTTVAP